MQFSDNQLQTVNSGRYGCSKFQFLPRNSPRVLLLKKTFQTKFRTN